MIQTRLGKLSDIIGVLELQELNLFKNLTFEELQHGFVTTPFTQKQIEDIISQDGLFVGLDEHQKVIAYVFAGDWSYFSQWDIFNKMTGRFYNLSFQNIPITTENSFQYGPICIHKDHRGRGIINQIFETMRLIFVDKYPISVTFINKLNKVSEHAHIQKLGWKVVDEFSYNGNAYSALAFDMSKSVQDKGSCN
ncbi:GNAT family acetyltransferase [Sediminicola sp. 1XM1-17]|uniref:GNAT family acetyltransferase n=1 Tax=Sediminicola sp. 1XM1-17 TaxID=3127702 RepID=UPI0030777727